MSLLHGINSPKDLKHIRVEDLSLVAQELRQSIIEACAKNGGHLGGSLGAVDLIIALHYCFDMPNDKIVWDVGHQAYAHKALTGRKDQMNTIRTTGGLSGFPKRDESPYDTYGTAHASTGISAALGIQIAKSLKNETHKVIVVVGDGGLTGGMAYEGLNQCGHLKKNLIVILNDNGMSISQNVGAITQFLTKRSTSDTYLKVRSELKHLLKMLSDHGVPLLSPAEKIKTSLKTLFSSGIFFESLGFRYLGPFDGHDIASLIEVFNHLPQLGDHPLFIHVITKKGKGYPPAEENPISSHGVSPFDPLTGKSLPKKPGPPAYTSVFANALIQLAHQNKKIIGITAAMPEGTGLDKFSKVFPDRYFDVGIAEQHAVVFAAGLATEGFEPACAIYSTFLQRAYDPIIHDVTLQRLPVHFFLDRAGFVGADGATHHGVFDISYLRCIPNMVIMAPKDENELQHMIKTSFDINGPTAVRYPRGNGYGVKLDEEFVSLDVGKAEIVYPEMITRESFLPQADLAVIALGSMVYPSIKAAQVLGDAGVSCLVINARFAKPLDEKLMIELAQTIPHLITVEENVLAGGFGSSILELLVKKGIQTSIFNLGIPDEFFDHATPEELKSQCGLDAAGIIRFIQEKIKLPKKTKTNITLIQK